MELDEWLKNDMKRYISNHEPLIERRELKGRKEDIGQLLNIDYEAIISRELKEHQFKKAQEHFKELKTKFENIGVDKQQERKQLFRVLQKSYKKIYDYVENRHKTARIMTQLSYSADVFNEEEPTVNLKDLEQEIPLPSIEESMIKKKTREDALKTNPYAIHIPSMPEEEQEPPQPNSNQQPVKQIIQTKDVHVQPTTTIIQTPGKQQRSIHIDKIVIQEAPKPTSPPPKPKPKSRIKLKPEPTIHDKPRFIVQPRIEPTRRTAESNYVHIRKQAARELLTEARERNIKNQLTKAQQKLLEARFEILRAGGDEEITRRINALEKHIQHKRRQDRSPEHHELFSSLYLRGIQAMNQGDYVSALNIFQQRVTQAPNDRAARIRLHECMEAVYGKNNR